MSSLCPYNLNLTATIWFTIQIVSNDIFMLNFKGTHMIVGLVWFHQNSHCISLVSPAIVISRLFVSKLLFHYLRHENLCFMHESVRLEVIMWDSCLRHYSWEVCKVAINQWSHLPHMTYQMTYEHNINAYIHDLSVSMLILRGHHNGLKSCIPSKKSDKKLNVWKFARKITLDIFSFICMTLSYCYED